MTRNSKTLKILSTGTLVFSLFILHASMNHSAPMSIETKRMEFINKIPVIAEQFIGIPYQYGGDFEKSGVVDNSHLFFKIYNGAATKTGLRWKGYLNMKHLLAQSIEIQRKDLRNGDLVFLNDGNAAMVYKFRDQDDFNLIYSSLKRKQVISFHCQNVVFKVYWVKNLKGYFRPSEAMIMQYDD